MSGADDNHARLLACMRAAGLDDAHIADARAAINLALEFLQSRQPDAPLATLVAGCAGMLASLLMPERGLMAEKIAPVYARIVNEILAATPWRLVETQ